jgi:hypothetical protein
MCQRTQNRIQHFIKALCQILREKTQNEVTILLEQSVLAAIASISPGIGHMLCPVDFDHKAGSYYLHPQSAGMITSPKPLLVIASTNGVIALNQNGQTDFHSSEPFELFGCQENSCYGLVEGQEIYRIEHDGSRQIVYRSPEPLLHCLLQPTGQMIYALSKSRISRVRLDGEVEGTVPVSPEVKSLVAVHPERIYAMTETNLVAIRDLPRANRQQP